MEAQRFQKSGLSPSMLAAHREQENPFLADN
jgi:hypothetical protein